MGKGNFQPPTELTPLNQSAQNLSQVITSAAVGDPYCCAKLRAHPSMGASGRMGEILQKFFYLYPFCERAP